MLRYTWKIGMSRARFAGLAIKFPSFQPLTGNGANPTAKRPASLLVTYDFVESSRRAFSGEGIRVGDPIHIEDTFCQVLGGTLRTNLHALLDEWLDGLESFPEENIAAHIAAEETCAAVFLLRPCLVHGTHGLQSAQL
jgi:hypothetical protein